MTYSLRVSTEGRLLFESPINQMYGRILALFALTFPEKIAQRAEDAPILIGKIAQTIEDALQESPAAHTAWVTLYDLTDSAPVVVELVGAPANGVDAISQHGGGGGGQGAWPGAGGGGGGYGGAGASGGNGADGALVVFEYSAQQALIDVEAFVTPGQYDWICPKGVASVDVIAIGGGGGGAGGGPRLHSAAPDAPQDNADCT